MWLKTADSSTACETSTLKSPLLLGSDAPHVHPRLRKRPPRCTLDCGFKTPESPALRGFKAERCPITGTSLYLVLKSNGLRHSKNPPVRFSFSLKIVPATIAKKLPLQLRPKPLFIAFFNFSHKRPTFAFASESGYTLAFANRIAHKGTHGETGAFRTGVVSLPSERSARSQTSPGRVSERRTLPLWDLGREVLPKNAESLRSSDALMRVAVPRRRGPAGLRNLFLLLSELWLVHPALRTLCVYEVGVVSLPSACFACSRNAGRPLVKKVHLPFSEVGWMPLPVRYFF